MMQLDRWEQDVAPMSLSGLISLSTAMAPATRRLTEDSALGINKEMLSTLLSEQQEQHDQRRRNDASFLHMLPMAFLSLTIALMLEEETNSLLWHEDAPSFGDAE